MASRLVNRVLITRPEPGATQTAARISALGLCPIVAPVLTIVAREVRATDRVSATLLTSRNAITACARYLHNRPVFAVGTATATRASEAGFRQVFSADGDAAALARLVADTLSPKDGTLFLPAGQGQGTELALCLRKHGFRVLRRVAYRAVGASVLPDAAATALRTGQLMAAMFFSRDTSAHFVRLLQPASLVETVRDVDAVAISERAAMPLRSLKWRRISVATKPNEDAILVLLT